MDTRAQMCILIYDLPLENCINLHIEGAFN